MFRAILIVAVFLIAPFNVLLAHAESQPETKDRWVLKETIDRTFLCESSALCSNPNMTIDQSGAQIIWGARAGECDASYQAIGKWSALPETLMPGQNLSILLEASLKQTSACEAAINSDNDSSLSAGKVIAPDTEVGQWQLIGNASVRGLLEKSKEFKDSKTIDWSVPQGTSGEQLHLRFNAGLGALPSGYITFIYDYQSGAVTAKDAPAEDKKEIAGDVCGINPARVNWRLPNPISLASARDSGARFVDFSGEVTVAPGNDPSDLHPAEMDMVLETGNIIKTESDSTAIISFADMTTFCMKPFTTVVLDTPPEKESKLSLLAGKVWVNVKKMIKDGTMNIIMNQAVAGIKGTIFMLEDDGVNSTIKVIEGEVQYTSRSNGSKLAVTSGETVTADKNGFSAETGFDIANERANWQEFVGNRSINNLQENNTSGLNYAFWSLLLAALIGGGWVVKKKIIK